MSNHVENMGDDMKPYREPTWSFCLFYIVIFIMMVVGIVLTIQKIRTGLNNTSDIGMHYNMLYICTMLFKT
jgi:hypothetical protein